MNQQLRQHRFNLRRSPVQCGNSGGMHRRRRRVVLSVPLGAGATHVVELWPVGVNEAPQHPTKLGKIRCKAQRLGAGTPLRLLIGNSHSGSHLATTQWLQSKRELGRQYPFLIAFVPLGNVAPSWMIVIEMNRPILQRLNRTPHFV
jgi:hypothetical protein